MVSFTLRSGAEQLPLLDLPWTTPLADWPTDLSVTLPAGNHRHVVRFIELAGTTLALKELPDRLARREYSMLELLHDEGLPAVAVVGIVTGRTSDEGDPLEGVLVTRHLPYSLPYRLLFSHERQVSVPGRVVDALAVLLVRLHTIGFFWGDCSLNNALFRRDAGALQAYVVDTETAERHQNLSPGQRRLDLDIAIDNSVGGLFDLDAEGLLPEEVDPIAMVEHLRDRYQSLWAELHEAEEIPTSELGRINARLARLTALVFDPAVYELEAGTGHARFRPTVVEEGHHQRTLLRLTGIEAQENQARRLLSAMRAYGAWLSQIEGEVIPEAIVAYRWLNERWSQALEFVPDELRSRLEDTEIYHEILEHNWYLNERSAEEVTLEDATADYVANILSGRSDERTVLDVVDV